MGISLSAGVRQSLQSLQSTAMSAQTAQSRLSTGKRVNSAIDNPVNFFTANALNDRADNLKNLLDGMSNTVQTIKAAATGVDGITKLVKSLQSTVKQALSDAAQNRPNKAGNALATAAEATATGKTLQQIALDKKLEGAATAATATSDGTLGVAANAVITLSNGKSSFTFNSNATATVRDLVNNINQSGVATASVDQNGKIALTGAGSENFTFSVGAAGASNTNVGFVAGDATTATAIGTAGNGAASATSAIRAGLVQQFSDVRSQIDQLAKDSGFNGTNLLNGDQLKTVFNEKTGASQSKQTIVGSKISSDNMGIIDASNGVVAGRTNFQNDNDLNSADAALTNAVASLTSLSSSLGASLSVVQTRQDFSNQLIDTLRSGADNLVNADTNEEGANLLALQTRQSLSQTALSLSAQADQAVLKLF